MVEKTTGDGTKPTLPDTVQRTVAEQLKKLSAAGVLTSDGSPLVSSSGAPVLAEPPALAYAHDGSAANTHARPAVSLVKNAEQAEQAANRDEALELLKYIKSLNAEVRALLTTEESLLSSIVKGNNATVNVDTIRKAVEQAVEKAEAAARAAETPEQKVDRLWGEIKALDKKIEKNLDSLHESGLIGDEEYERLKKERARLDKLDVNDPERIAGERKYNAELKKLGIEAGNEADRRGDEVGKETAKEVVKGADERKVLIDKVSTLSVSAAVEQERKVVTQQPVAHEEGGKPVQVATTSAIPTVAALPSMSVSEGDTGTLAAPKKPTQVTKIDAPVPGGTGF